MALTARRWIGIALLGAAAIAVAFLPPSPTWWEGIRGRGAIFYQGSDAQVQVVNRALSRAKDALWVLSRRDTLVRLVNALHPRAGVAPVVGFEGAWTEPQRARLRQMVADAWRSLGPTSPEVPVAIVFRNNPNRQAGFLASGNWYLLPGATGGTCIVAATPNGTATSWPVGGVRSVLGPCAFYGVFGRPGAPIEQWLLHSAFWQGADADWLSPRPPTPVLGDDDLSISDMSTDYLLEAVAALSYEGLGISGAACATGDLTVCRRIVQSNNAGGALFLRETAVTAPIVRMPNAYYTQSFDRQYLDDLVRAQGRDKFGRFWSTDLSPDSAFTAVYRTSIEEWTRSWIRERRPGLHVGPKIRMASVLWGFLSIIAFVGVGAAFAQRRRIV